MTYRTVSRVVIRALMVALAAGVPAITHGQRGDPAEFLLQAARQKQQVEGKLEEAIRLYQEIAKTHGTNRPVVARATYEMGLCYEKLGAARGAAARNAYERILTQYSDQPDVVAQARARLSAMSRALRTGDDEPRITRLWTAPSADGSELLRISPDGRYLEWLAYTGEGFRYIVRELATGAERSVTYQGWVDTSFALSRDGRRFVHDWHDEETKQRGLSIGELSSSSHVAERRLPMSFNWVEPHDWSPDGKSIVAIASTGERSGNAPDRWSLILVSAEEGTVRTLRPQIAYGTSYARFSPDGGYVAINVFDGRDIEVLRVEDGSKVAAIAHPANDELVGWSPDGASLLFTSDRQGTNGLWAQRFANGRLMGTPALLKGDLSAMYHPSVGPSGAVAYIVYNSVRTELRIGSFDYATGQWTEAPVDGVREYVRGIPPAANPSPAWSRDGKSFAYLMGDSSNQFTSNARIVVRASTDKAGWVIQPNISTLIAPISWSPDGSYLVAAGGDPYGQWAIWRIDPRTGALSPLVPSKGVIYVRRWSADGSRLYFEKNTGDMERGIFEFDLSSGKERPLLTFHVRNRQDVSVVGNGEKVIYREAQLRDGKWPPIGWTIFEHDVTTGTDREVARGQFSGLLGASPDGRWLAAVATDDSPAASTVLQLLPFAGGAPRELLRAPVLKPAQGARSGGVPAALALVRWAPDGASLFVKKRVTAEGAAETWWVPVDGRQPKRIDDGASGEMTSFGVHPDGRQLAFALRPSLQPAPSEVWSLENVLKHAK